MSGVANKSTIKISSKNLFAEYGRPTRWVTRERPKIDRIACPWLVMRFIDPNAVFLFAPGKDVLAVAEQKHAIPFDIPGVQLTHRGEDCAFDTMLGDFELRDPALARIAVVIRGADTGRLDLAPEAAGLLAISLGLCARETDDHKLLELGFVVYDGLYAWAKHASAERHGWPPQ
jgi:hypothetical protein